MNRLRENIFRALHPSAPWLTPEAIRYLDNWLNTDKKGVELGSGRSTTWLAKRCHSLISVESDKNWYDQVSEALDIEGLRNVSYHFAPVSQDMSGIVPQYLLPLSESADNTFDFALVDGEYRDLAAVIACDKVAPGGIVIIDNCNWYLPSDTKSPSSIPSNGTAATPLWEQFLSITGHWQRKWTSNGVTDTVFFIKPQPQQ